MASPLFCTCKAVGAPEVGVPAEKRTASELQGISTLCSIYNDEVHAADERLRLLVRLLVDD